MSLHSCLRNFASCTALASEIYSASQVDKARGGEGGLLPMMAYTGRLRPKGVPFSCFRYIKGHKRVGISQAEVFKRVGKSVI